MPLEFYIIDDTEAYRCARYIKEIAEDFGFSKFDAGMFSLAVTEILINSIRYAKDVKVICQYTQNKKGLEVKIEDKGEGIKDLAHSLEDGISSLKDSLGIGLGAAKRSADEFLIQKSDASGTSIILRKYIDSILYEYTPISVKKEHKEFNGDAYFIKHYDGDKSLFAIIEGKGKELRAYKSAQSVKGFLLEYYRLPLDEIVAKLKLMFLNDETIEDATIVLLRFYPAGIEYLILGDGFILSSPRVKFHAYHRASCLQLPKKIQVHSHLLENGFCIIMASDGIDKNIAVEKSFKNFSTLEIATDIFNSYNVDDDSTLIVIKKGEE
ncbi:ATP-binding protein [Sulfurimonas sp. NWX79]|uniref:ATP-binding protein n=1 Tax=Sulfurimonas sp. NWX79 TaxID=2925412 RepID=UPI003204D0E6